MENIIKPVLSITTEKLKTTRASIFPFTELPGNDVNEEDQTEKNINAAELFSFFTANIINEEVVFTR